MMGARTFAASALAVALTACGHVETHEIVLRAPGAAQTADPDLYVEGKGPERAFYEVALLQVIGYGSDANPDDVTGALLARAKTLGCDAVVRAHVDQGSARANGFGVCVRWSPTSASPMSASPVKASPTSAPPVTTAPSPTPYAPVTPPYDPAPPASSAPTPL